MHELGLASEIVKTVQARLAEDGITGAVSSIELEIGEMRQVLADTLQFCLDSLVGGTQLEGARLLVKTVPVSGSCRQCGRELVLKKLPFICPGCQSTRLDLSTGYELVIRSFQVRS